MNNSTYALPAFRHVLRHFPTTVPLLRDAVAPDGAPARRQELVARVRSGQYFASLAMQLENLSTDPYIELETLQHVPQGFADELLYLQETHKITKQ